MRRINDEEIVCRKLLSDLFVRDCFLSGTPWKYFGYSIPLHVFDKDLNGDLDILVRLTDIDPESGEITSEKEIVRAIEVKIFKVCGSKVSPTREKQALKTKKQIEKLHKIGFNWVYLFDVFILSDLSSVEEKELCFSVVNKRKNIAIDKNLGYLFLLCDRDLNTLLLKGSNEEFFQSVVNLGTDKLTFPTLTKESLAEKIIKDLDKVSRNEDPRSDIITFDYEKKVFTYEYFSISGQCYR